MRNMRKNGKATHDHRFLHQEFKEVNIFQRKEDHIKGNIAKEPPST